MKHKMLNMMKNVQFYNIIFQPTKGVFAPDNMFVINFLKEDKIISLHVFCFLRIVVNNELLLTSSDEYVDLSYKQLSNGETWENSLVKANISKVNKLLKNTCVESVNLLECGDFIIQLPNKIKIEVRPDCLLDGYEHYRLFELEDFSHSIKIINKDRKVFYCNALS